MRVTIRRGVCGHLLEEVASSTPPISNSRRSIHYRSIPSNWHYIGRKSIDRSPFGPTQRIQGVLGSRRGKRLRLPLQRRAVGRRHLNTRSDVYRSAHGCTPENRSSHLFDRPPVLARRLYSHWRLSARKVLHSEFEVFPDRARFDPGKLGCQFVLRKALEYFDHRLLVR